MVHDTPFKINKITLTFADKAKRASERYNDLYNKPVKSSVAVLKDEAGREFAEVSLEFFDDSYSDQSVTYEIGVFMGMYIVI